jgi:hypothetical protein
LNLQAVSAAGGQVAQSAFSRRIACAADQGACASNTGMPVAFVDLAAPTPEDFDRAMDALRRLQAICRSTPPAAN